MRKQPPEVFCEKGALRIFTKFAGKQLCQSLFFNKVAGLRSAFLLKKRPWDRCEFCEFCEISKNTFFHRTPLVAASIHNIITLKIILRDNSYKNK